MNEIDLQNEQAVIGAILLHEKALEVVRPILGDNFEWADKRHGAIWRALLDLKDNRTPIDELTLHTHLKNRRLSTAAGGLTYIAELQSKVPTSANVEYYAKQVREAQASREIATLSRKTAAQAGNGGSMEQIRADLVAALARCDEAIGTRPHRTLITRTADTIEELPIVWRWTLRIPESSLIELCGMPGVGKSTLARYIAAIYSAGGRFPQCSERHAPAKVLYFSGEDDSQRVLVPSLRAMGANLANIVIVDGTGMSGDDYIPIKIPCDLPLLEAHILDTGAKIAILDPLSSFWDGELDSYKDTDARVALAQMTRIAERTGCTFLNVRHLNKSTGGHAVHRASGSGAFTAASRVSLGAGKNPQDPELAVLACIKSNLDQEPSALEYKIVRDQATGAARIAWGAQSSITATELFAEPEQTSRAVEEAVSFLRDELAQGRVYTNDLQTRAKEAGISWGTIKRAVPLAGATSAKEKGQGGKFYWELTGKVA